MTMNSVSDHIRITYPVKKSHLEHALRLLGKAQRTTRRVHNFICSAAVVFIITVVASISLNLIFRPEFGIGALGIVTALLTLLTFGAGVVLVIAFLAELPLMGVHWWFAHRLSNLGLGQIVLIRSSGKARFLQILGALGTPIGVLFISGSVMAVTIFLALPEAERVQTGAGITPLCLYLAFGLLLTLPHFISRRRRSRALLRRIDALEQRLSPYITRGPADQMVDIAVEDLNLMARVEEAQIEQERAKAVAQARREARADDYVLLTSRRAANAMGQLRASLRVRVQEEAVGLTRQTKPGNATWDDSAAIWRLEMPDSDIQLNYQIDDGQHQIKLISVERLEENTGVGER